MPPCSVQSHGRSTRQAASTGACAKPTVRSPMTDLRFAIDICPLGELSDPRAIVRLARAAEDSGWDGLSIWDSLGLSMGTVAADPFVTLAGRRCRDLAAPPHHLDRRPVAPPAAARRAGGGHARPRSARGASSSVSGPARTAPTSRPSATRSSAPERIDRMDEALAIVDRGLRGEPLEHPGPLLEAQGGVVLGPRPVAAAAPAHLARGHEARRHPPRRRAGRAGSSWP